MSRLFEIEPEEPKPRQKPQKRMHVIDAGGGDCGGFERGEHLARFGCAVCKAETEWMKVKNITEGKRGIPCLTCNFWQLIETAPKDGTIVELSSQNHPDMTPQCMAWDGVRWFGMDFGVLGSKEIWWDENDPPTHWRAIE